MSFRAFTIFFAIGLALVPVALYIQVSVWNECRADGHSFFYCSALINGK